MKKLIKLTLFAVTGVLIGTVIQEKTSASVVIQVPDFDFGEHTLDQRLLSNQGQFFAKLQNGAVPHISIDATPPPDAISGKKQRRIGHKLSVSMTQPLAIYGANPDGSTNYSAPQANSRINGAKILIGNYQNFANVGVGNINNRLFTVKGAMYTTPTATEHEILLQDEGNGDPTLQRIDTSMSVDFDLGQATPAGTTDGVRLEIPQNEMQNVQQGTYKAQLQWTYEERYEEIQSPAAPEPIDAPVDNPVVMQQRISGCISRLRRKKNDLAVVVLASKHLGQEVGVTIDKQVTISWMKEAILIARRNRKRITSADQASLESWARRNDSSSPAQCGNNDVAMYADKANDSLVQKLMNQLEASFIKIITGIPNTILPNFNLACELAVKTYSQLGGTIHNPNNFVNRHVSDPGANALSNRIEKMIANVKARKPANVNQFTFAEAYGLYGCDLASGVATAPFSNPISQSKSYSLSYSNIDRKVSLDHMVEFARMQYFLNPERLLFKNQADGWKMTTNAVLNLMKTTSVIQQIIQLNRILLNDEKCCYSNVPTNITLLNLQLPCPGSAIENSVIRPW